jgi:hypothetical protein
MEGRLVYLDFFVVGMDWVGIFRFGVFCLFWLDGHGVASDGWRS